MKSARRPHTLTHARTNAHTPTRLVRASGPAHVGARMSLERRVLALHQARQRVLSIDLDAADVIRELKMRSWPHNSLNSRPSSHSAALQSKQAATLIALPLCRHVHVVSRKVHVVSRHVYAVRRQVYAVCRYVYAVSRKVHAM